MFGAIAQLIGVFASANAASNQSILDRQRANQQAYTDLLTKSNYLGLVFIVALLSLGLLFIFGTKK